MAFSTALFLLASLIPFCSTIASKTLSLNVEVMRGNPNAITIDKHHKATQGLLSQVYQIGYWTNITIGTPPQQLFVQLDTGSSDTWIPSINSTICQKVGETCALFGSYNISHSSTSKNLGDYFLAVYGDETVVLGTFFTDYLGFGIEGATIPNVQIGLADFGIGPDDFEGFGKMAIGFDSAEFGVQLRKPTYPNVLSQLKLNGLINTRAYSVWLGNLTAQLGTILFGGVDASKYTGPLNVLPIVDAPIKGADVPRTAVQLTSLNYQDDDGSFPLMRQDEIYRVTLDTGSTTCSLPISLADKVYTAAGVTNEEQTFGHPLVNCNFADSKGDLTFGFGGFGGPKIKTPFRELVLDLGDEITFSNGSRACLFGIGKADFLTGVILGDTFLRSTYAVFDLDKRQIALAQAATNVGPTSSSDQIKEITEGSDSIPGAQKAAVSPLPWPSSYVHAWESQSGLASGAATPATSTLPDPNSAAARLSVAWKLIVLSAVGFATMVFSM